MAKYLKISDLVTLVMTDEVLRILGIATLTQLSQHVSSQNRKTKSKSNL